MKKIIFQKFALHKPIISFFTRLVSNERSPEKCALAFAIGLYIAFSPFPGLHGPMAIACIWAFQLNSVVTLGATYLNNPLTTVPFFVIDYSVGYWLLHTICKNEWIPSNPSWMRSVNEVLQTRLGMPEVCLWSFFVGGNIVGIIAALISYPLVKICVKQLGKHNENYYTKS